ncbi:hypothetical protein HAZT_HAZT000789 [Hyalella azteca]|uniref:Mediator of RNA polymerase II transcription subunit 23 n=1 Tax=Hyalella azteca TaxID=294128 RepID=A0A6A0H1A9_HYAAZ|nr:hypothetical protein HAZT_HAZT000789 [Hyalella azteca]
MHQGDPLQQNLFNYLKLDDPEKAEQKLTTIFSEVQKLLDQAGQSSSEPSSDGNRPSRLLCVTILTHEKLKPENSVFWITAFGLMKDVISGVDYKGVREIMKMCLEVCRQLPTELKHSQVACMTALCELLEHICDPNAALLPAYFVVNELLKLCPDYQKWPHWKVSRLLTDFVENFQRAAQLLSIVNRTKLRPVVEHSGHNGWSISSWKLDSRTLKFGLNGSLPYSSELLAPQPALLNHVLRQPYSKEMVCAMIDMTKKKQRCSVLEDQLITLMVSSLHVCHATDLYNQNKASESAAQATDPAATAATDGTSQPAPSSGLEDQDDANAGAGSGTTAMDTSVATPSGTSSSATPGATTSSPSSASSAGAAPSSPDHYPCPCHHLSSLLIHFVLHQLINFPALVIALHAKLQKLNMRVGRDHLMWVLLQYLSGTIQKNPFPEFLPVLRLIEYLYPERTPLPVPDYTDPSCVLKSSAMCILIHILRKAQAEYIKTPRALPPAFTNHNELIQSLVHNPQLSHIASNFSTTPSPDYRIALLLNAFSTNTVRNEMFHRPILALTEGIQSSQKSTVPMPGVNCVAHGATVPLSMTLLDSLSIHVKMSLLHNIGQYITKQAHTKSTIALAPALVETYARLLVYIETETIGIKQFITNLLPVVFKSQVWGILHGLLEMFSHRIHHSPPHYRVQLLSTIHHMTIPLNTLPNMTHLHLCLESVALRLISGLGNSEVMSSLARLSPDSKTVISGESEELNKVLVLTLARAIHVTGFDSSSDSARWCLDFLRAVMNHTPHTWPTHTMQCFPRVIEEYYKQVPGPRDTHNLKKEVDEEYCKWKSMSNENDIIAHFSRQQQTSTLFLCLLFKMVLEQDRVPVEAYKVLERLGPRQLMSHIRTLCDFLVLEFSNCALGQYLSKCVNTMNAIIWVYHIVPLDRLMLCLALRIQEGSSKAQVCMFIIQLLLLRQPEFRNRVNKFVSENMPDHWNHNNWYEQHMAFHRKFPEKFSPESLVGGGGGGQSGHHQTLPIYFTNVCLRFLPVLDIIIHRFLEAHQVHKRLEMVLEQLGVLYKFHDHPITYLYNTLHYYEGRLRESPKLKRQLVAAVIGNSVKPKGWALTEEYLATPPEEITWVPKPSYYTALIRRLVLAQRGVRVFPHGMEWRFSEFGNSGTHALYVTCVELMALSVMPDTVAENLFDVVVKGHCDIPARELGEYINAVALVLTWLPESYWLTVHHRIVNLLQCPELSSNSPPSTLDIFSLMRLDLLQPCVRHSSVSLTIALVHAFWHHSSLSQLGRIPQLMKEQIRGILETEAQLVCLFQLVGPFLSRFSVDIARKVFDVTLEFYHALAKVDESVTEFMHQDAICDVLYHIKYMFTGDSIKPDLEGIIRGLRPDLQRRLRFITHLNLSNIQAGPTGSATPTTLAPSTSTNSTPSSVSGAACSSSSPAMAAGISPSGNA